MCDVLAQVGAPLAQRTEVLVDRFRDQGLESAGSAVTDRVSQLRRVMGMAY